jgi:WD40 repeat protein
MLEGPFGQRIRMEYESTRQLRLSSNLQDIVLGAYEKYLCLFDPDSKKVGKIVKTNLDCGGSRFGYTNELQAFIAAAYHRYGIELYSSISGEVIWKRKDIKRTQKISLSIDGKLAFTSFSDGPLQVIDLHSGATIEKMRGITSYIESEDGKYVFVEDRQPYIEIKELKSKMTLEKESFAILSVDISNNVFLVSESCANIRCFDINNKELLWRYNPRPGIHFLSVAIVEQSAFCVSWPYQKGGDKEIVQFNLENGKIIKRKKIGCPIDVIIVPKKRIAITSDGREINLTNMKETHVFSRNIF